MVKEALVHWITWQKRLNGQCLEIITEDLIPMRQDGFAKIRTVIFLDAREMNTSLDENYVQYSVQTVFIKRVYTYSMYDIFLRYLARSL